jgi:hypothetical protein
MRNAKAILFRFPAANLALHGLASLFAGQSGFKHSFQGCFPLSHTLITGYPQLLQGALNGFIAPFWGNGKVTLHFSSK